MSDNEHEQDGTTPGDPSAAFVRDLANASPPKGVETIKAASDAVEKTQEHVSHDERHDAIRRRAYELWEQSGCPDGKHTDFWLQAEQEADAAKPET